LVKELLPVTYKLPPTDALPPMLELLPTFNCPETLVIVEFKLILPVGADTALGPPGVCDLDLIL